MQIIGVKVKIKITMKRFLSVVLLVVVFGAPNEGEIPERGSGLASKSTGHAQDRFL